jgi:hypothetical protein
MLLPLILSSASISTIGWGYQNNSLSNRAPLCVSENTYSTAPLELGNRRNWKQFLLGLSARHEISDGQALRINRFWDSLRDVIPYIPDPHGMVGEDGSFGMVWDKGEHHLEIEFPVSGKPFLFYLNHRTDRTEMMELSLADSLPPRFSVIAQMFLP